MECDLPWSQEVGALDLGCLQDILLSVEHSELTPLEITVTVPINLALSDEPWQLEVANDFVWWKPRV
jgi:hypothetical protein